MMMDELITNYQQPLTLYISLISFIVVDESLSKINPDEFVNSPNEFFLVSV